MESIPVKIFEYHMILIWKMQQKLLQKYIYRAVSFVLYKYIGQKSKYRLN